MAFATKLVSANTGVVVPVGVTTLVSAQSTIDLTSGNDWSVGRGPGVTNVGSADPSALSVIKNPGTAVANGGRTVVMQVQINAPVLQTQTIYCTGDNPTLLIFS